MLNLYELSLYSVRRSYDRLLETDTSNAREANALPIMT